MPPTIPEVGFTVPTAVLPLDQLPKLVMSLKSVVVPAHRLAVPLMAEGNGLTATVAVV